MQSHAQRIRKHRFENPESCFLCGKHGHFPELLRAAVVRPDLAAHIAKARGVTWQAEGRVCQACLGAGRTERLLERLRRERGRLSALDQDVARRIAEHESIPTPTTS